MLQQQNPHKPNLDSHEQASLLLDFARSISLPCANFLNQLLSITTQHTTQQTSLTPKQLLGMLSEIFVYEKVKTKQPICARVFNQESVVFVCYDCNTQDGIICVQCFNKGNHKGHKYHKQTSWGTCDCGDEGFMKKQGFCTDHDPLQTFQIEVNKEETQIFIKQMKFLFFLLQLIAESQDKKLYNMLSVSYPLALTKFLINFNQESMISNQMTFMLFSANFSDIVPAEFDFNYREKSVLELILNFYELDEQCNLAVDLFVLLFARPKFKRFYIVTFFKVASEQAKIWKTKIAQRLHVICSYKWISELIDSKEIKPLSVSKIPQDWNFKLITGVFSRYFAVLFGFSKLNFGVGRKFIKWSINQGNIVDWIKYGVFASDDPQECIEEYSIEYRYTFFMQRKLKIIREDKFTLLKAIKDIATDLQKRDPSSQMTLFLPRERTLCFLIIEFFDGQILKDNQSDFLYKIGLSYEIVYSILQSVLHVLRFYSLTCSNLQTFKRFKAFSYYSVLNTSRILSIDFELLKICLLSLKQLQSTRVQIHEPETQPEPQYQKSMKIAESRMPIENLIAFPIKFIQKLLSSKIQDNQQGAYDRKKAVQMLVDYIGLLHESIITKNSSLNVRNSLGLDQEKQLQQFYGSFIKSLGQVKNEDFNKMCRTFFQDQTCPYFKQFFNEKCDITDKKISFKKESENYSKAYNLSYLRSKKKCSYFQPYWELNKKNYNLSHIPRVQLSSSQIQQKKILTDTIFNQKFLNRIINILKQYQKMLNTQPEIRKSDISFFSQLIEEIIRINYTLKSQKIHVLLLELRKHPQILDFMTQYIQKEISICLGKFDQNQNMEKLQNVNQSKSQKLKSAKQMKLLKFKEKQNKAYEKIIGEGQKNQQNVENVCIFCRQSDETNQLQGLNYISGSTLFSKLYLDCTRTVYKITACGHNVYSKCFKKAYGDGQQIYCELCKFYSNIQLELSIQGNNQEKSISSADEFFVNTKIYDFIKQQQEISTPKMLERLPDKNIKQSFPLWSKLSLQQKILQSLATTIIQGILIQKNLHEQKQFSILVSFFSNLRNRLNTIKDLVKEVWEQTSTQSRNQNVRICRLAYKLAILCISSHLLSKDKIQFMSVELKKLQQLLPKQISESITSVVSAISNTRDGLSSAHFKEILSKNTEIILFQPQFPSLPKNLQELSNLCTYECPHCQQKTNELALCLICKLISCQGCKVKSLTSHTLHHHGSSAVFLRIDIGCPIYISKLKHCILKSLYKNYLGEGYTLNFLTRQLIRSDFQLDLSGYEKIIKDITKNRIKQEIEYNRKNKGAILQIIP